MASSKTADFSVTAPTVGSGTTGDAKKFFLCDATSGPIIGTLPSAASAGNGFSVAFKKTDATANTVTIAATIDGATNVVLSTQNASVTIVSNGTAWYSQTNSVDLSGYAPINSPTFTGVPVVPDVALGTTSTQAVNAKFANPGFSAAVNGYRKNADGTISQWGSASITTNPLTISFPIPFTTSGFNIVATCNDLAHFSEQFNCAFISLSQFQVSCLNTVGGQGVSSFFWRAEGK